MTRRLTEDCPTCKAPRSSVCRALCARVQELDGHRKQWRRHAMYLIDRIEANDLAGAREYVATELGTLLDGDER